MGYIAFIDESGDHGLKNIDPGSPVFVLCAAVYSVPDYVSKEIPYFANLRIKRWGHEGVIFHSYEIRKRVHPFSFCSDRILREEFLEEINEFFRRSPATIIAAAIDKEAHVRQYSSPENPYFLSVQFVLERIGMISATDVQIVFESRGVAEDKLVRNWCLDVCGGKNFRGQKYDFTVSFAKKKHNVTGLQVSDLACPPIAHYVKNRRTERPDWAIVKSKLRSSPNGSFMGYGLKIFPH